MAPGGGHTSPTIHVGVLGPVRVRCPDGHEAPVRGQIQQGLLAMLAMADDGRVSTSALVEGLWGDRPPGDPRHALQAHVSRLRRALPTPRVIVARPGEYLIDRVRLTVDADTFQELVDGGREAARAGDHVVAAHRFHDALDLWRGPPLEGVADAPGLAPTAVRLESLRLRALEHRVEADLAVGATDGLTAELRELVGHHPTRERLWAALVTALHRDHQQAEALAAYREARAALAEHAGVEPGPLLVAAQAAVLRHPAAPSPVRPGAASPARGPGHVRPRLRRLATGPFVGRRRDRRSLERLWEAGSDVLQVAVLSGPPGVGKTRLLAEVGARLAARGAPSRYARCEADPTEPMQPIAELVREDLATTGGRLGRHPQELARLVPDLLGHGAPTTGSRAAQRARLLDAIASWTAEVGDERPPMFVVDDLQWADEATLAAIRHVVRGPAPVRGLLVLALRPDGLAALGRVGRFCDDLARDQRQVRRLHLGGLPPAPTAELFVAELPPRVRPGATRRDAVAPRLHALTEGNPFRTIALARRVGDLLTDRAGLHHDPRGVSAGAADELASRLRGDVSDV